MIVVEETLNKKWNWWPLFPLYPYGKKKTILRELIPDQIWSLEQIQGLYYVAVPIRMTVIKVDNGLMLINPLEQKVGKTEVMEILLKTLNTKMVGAEEKGDCPMRAMLQTRQISNPFLQALLLI